MAQRVLFRTKAEAYAAAKKSGESFYKSVCDCDELSEVEDTELQRGGVAGETNCFRTEGGSVYAWWEE